jgi:nicotinic acid mononucleotide adenylyltransferase
MASRHAHVAMHLASNSPAGGPALLVLSGSFNPVHREHLTIIEQARGELERIGWTIRAGFLAPSSDAYVRKKLGAEAIALPRRIHLCRLAVAAASWIEVCETGELSSYRTARRLRETWPGNDLTVIEIMGGDTAVRLLGQLVQEWDQIPPGERLPWYRGRTVFCVPRPGPEMRDRSAYLLDVVARRAAEFGLEVMLSKESMTDDISSQSVRRMIRRSEWGTLRELNWLHPDVLRYLEMASRRPS